MSDFQLRETDDKRAHPQATDERTWDNAPPASDFGTDWLAHTMSAGAASPINAHSNTPARISMMQQMQHTHGNRAVQRYMHSEQRTPSRTVAVQRDRVPGPKLPDVDEDADEVLRIASNPQTPGLSAYTAKRVEALLKAGKKQAAIDAIVNDMSASGDMDPALLKKGKVKFSTAVPGEGLAAPPGYTKDKDKNVIAKPTDLGIGPAAFGKGLPWLYSSIMHEYQHVKQFQTTDEGKKTGSDDASVVHGQAANVGLIHEQEVEAYATEIINSHKTGMFNNKAQMREAWSRLFNDHWVKLSAKRRAEVQSLYDSAHAIYQESQKADAPKPKKK